jgi:hypothetical protein
MAGSNGRPTGREKIPRGGHDRQGDGNKNDAKTLMSVDHSMILAI